VNVVVSVDVLKRLAMAPQNVSINNALVQAGMAPDLVTRILEDDDTPQVGDWRAEQVLVLTQSTPESFECSHETGIDWYPTSYLRGLPLIDVGCDGDVAQHMAAML
jgi:hypothetical protein